MPTPKSKLHSSSKTSQTNTVHAHQINLLSDTGLALRQIKMKQSLFKITGITIGIITLFSITTFIYWSYTTKARRNVQSQISTLEQRLATFSEVNQLSSIYRQRLMKIQQLLSQQKTQSAPWVIYQQLLNISQESNGELNKLSFSNKNILVGINVFQIEDAKKMLKIIEELETQKLWSNVVITDFIRLNANSYQINFTANLNSN